MWIRICAVSYFCLTLSFQNKSKFKRFKERKNSRNCCIKWSCWAFELSGSTITTKVCILNNRVVLSINLALSLFQFTVSKIVKHSIAKNQKSTKVLREFPNIVNFILCVSFRIVTGGVYAKIQKGCKDYLKTSNIWLIQNAVSLIWYNSRS